MRGPLHKGGLAEGEGAVPRSSDSCRGPLTRNLREERANSGLSPQAGRGEAARLSLNFAPMGPSPASTPVEVTQALHPTGSHLGLGCSILHTGNSGLFGTVGATEGLALCLDPVADDAAAAMGAPGRHAFDRTFETVECHAPLTLSDNDRLVIFVSAHITHRHMSHLSVRFAEGAAARLLITTRHGSDSGGHRPGRCRTAPLPSHGHSGT